MCRPPGHPSAWPRPLGVCLEESLSLVYPDGRHCASGSARICRHQRSGPLNGAWEMSFWTRAGPLPCSSRHASAGPVPESLCLPSQRSQHICPRHPGTRQAKGSQGRIQCRQIPDPRMPSPQASGSASPSSGPDPDSSSQTRRQRRASTSGWTPPPQPGPFPWELHGRCLWAPCFVYQRPSSLCIRHWCQPLLRGDPSDAGSHLGPTGFPTHPLPTPSTELPQISG